MKICCKKWYCLVYYIVWINNEERVPLLQKHNSVGNFAQLILQIGPVKTQNLKGLSKDCCRVTQIRSFIPETLTAMAAKCEKPIWNRKQGSGFIAHIPIFILCCGINQWLISSHLWIWALLGASAMCHVPHVRVCDGTAGGTGGLKGLLETVSPRLLIHTDLQ